MIATGTTFPERGSLSRIGLGSVGCIDRWCPEIDRHKLVGRPVPLTRERDDLARVNPAITPILVPPLSPVAVPLADPSAFPQPWSLMT